MKLFKKLGFVALLVTFITVLTGCGSLDNAVSADFIPNDGSNIQSVGLILPQMEAPFFIGVEAQIREKLESEGIRVETATSDNNLTTQLEVLENFGKMGLDGVIIFPLGGSDVSDTLQGLRAQGMRVISIVNPQESGFDGSIMTSADEIGTTMAQMAAEWIDATFPDAAPGSIEVGLLTNRVSPDSIAVSEGMAQITDFTDKATIVADYEATFADGEVRVAENTEMLLTAFPNVKVVMAFNHALAVDEVVLRTSGINLDEFAVFSDPFEPAVEGRIRISPDNQSVIRGITMAGDRGRWDHAVDAMLGRLEFNNEGIYWNPIFGVTADNINELVGNGN